VRRVAGGGARKVKSRKTMTSREEAQLARLTCKKIDFPIGGRWCGCVTYVEERPYRGRTSAKETTESEIPSPFLSGCVDIGQRSQLVEDN
jgi:hypothetical protein